MRTKITTILILLCFSRIATAQTFTDIQANLTGLAESSCGWIDIDRDGDLDIIVAGDYFNNSVINIKTAVYANKRNNQFVAVAHNLPHFYKGDFAFADFNLDGIQDVAIVGENAAGKPIAQIYKGTANGSFTLTNITLEPVRYASVDWADFDNDGAPDLLLTGESADGPVSSVYRNNKNGTFTKTNTNLVGVKNGTAKWFDYNLDGYPDILLTGQSNKGPVTILYRNTGAGFILDSREFIQLQNSNIAFGDVDNDGDLDILLLGETANGQKATRLYRNDRTRGFRLIDIGFVDVSHGFADWGDMDHDGDLDLLISGEGENGPVSKIYRNDRRQGFIDIGANVIPLYMSDGQWGDYDLDGDLDILISGLSIDNRAYTKVYRNDGVKISSGSNSDGELADWEMEGENSLFFGETHVSEDTKPIYFYVYSSTYSDLYGTGKKDYYTFISPIKRPKYQYEMEDKYNDLIIKTYSNWSEIDQGKLIHVGFRTLKEAEASRNEIMHQYAGKKFHIIELDW